MHGRGDRLGVRTILRNHDPDCLRIAVNGPRGLAGHANRPVHDLLRLARSLASGSLASVEQTRIAGLIESIGQLLGEKLGTKRAPLHLSSQRDDERISARFIETLRDAIVASVAQGEIEIKGRDLALALQGLDSARTALLPEVTGEFARHLGGTESVSAVVEIAHDMRSPLTSILFLVDTLRRGQSGAVSPVQERQLGLIYGAALGLNVLACDVIDAVRGGHGLVDGPPVPFSINDVIMGVSDTVRPISEEKGLPIMYELSAPDGRVGYPAALSRVLLNLLTNSLKYTERGSVTIGCTELAPGRVTFMVRDTGDGIPPHVMSMLFDGFRPSASGVRFSNAGLGLAICQSFLAAMGSSLVVESGRESGTAFSFELALPLA